MRTTSTLRRAGLIAGLAGLAASGAASALPGTAQAANCGAMSVTLAGHKGTAKAIRASGTSCTKAKPVVAACMKNKTGKLKGWKISGGVKTGARTKLSKGGAHLSFLMSGRGGCALPHGKRPSS